MKGNNIRKCLTIMLACIFLLCGCNRNVSIDDLATNEGYVKETEIETKDKGVPRSEIKVGVLHITDPAEGSGYSYTHDIGIQGMQENLGLSDNQIIRKINVKNQPEEQKATHSSILAWRIPWTEEPSGLQSIRSQKVGHELAT